jgi:hypothetical protein
MYEIVQECVQAAVWFFLCLFAFIAFKQFFMAWRRRRRWVIDQVDEYDSQSAFIDWQIETMMYTVIANGSLCDDGFAISVNPDSITEMAAEIRERAREGETCWSHAVTARATDATIGWCARWLGMVNPYRGVSAEAYKAAHLEISDITAGGNISISNNVK